MNPEVLAQVLRPVQQMFNPADYPDLLVGLGVPDDAAVLRLDETQALVFTTDFFTPIVDEPGDYGRIAAANAISDVYAMGARPLLALNIVALPPDLPVDMVEAIIMGMAEKVRESSAVVAGGHTIQDKEPKIGLAVVGMAHPDNLLTKSGAQPGDVLVLTKPLGTGTITTAAKREQVDTEHLHNATKWMSRLNRAASEAALAVKARTATDITGFGFIGHSVEIANSSEVTLRVEFNQIPLLDGVEHYAEEWIFPGGSADNMRIYENQVQFAPGIQDEQKMILFDAQTSGGLLIAIPETDLTVFAETMQKNEALWWQVGRVIDRQEQAIIVQ